MTQPTRLPSDIPAAQKPRLAGHELDVLLACGDLSPWSRDVSPTTLQAASLSPSKLASPLVEKAVSLRPSHWSCVEAISLGSLATVSQNSCLVCPMPRPCTAQNRLLSRGPRNSFGCVLLSSEGSEVPRVLCSRVN